MAQLSKCVQATRHACQECQTNDDRQLMSERERVLCDSLASNLHLDGAEPAIERLLRLFE